jgi:hypothetical protein
MACANQHSSPARAKDCGLVQVGYSENVCLPDQRRCRRCGGTSERGVSSSLAHPSEHG